jgi:hypothetical protein
LADAVIANADADITDASQHPEKREQGTSSAQNKKRAGRSALLKNCVDPIFPKIGFDLD